MKVLEQLDQMMCDGSEMLTTQRGDMHHDILAEMEDAKDEARLVDKAYTLKQCPASRQPLTTDMVQDHLYSLSQRISGVTMATEVAKAFLRMNKGNKPVIRRRQ